MEGTSAKFIYLAPCTKTMWFLKLKLKHDCDLSTRCRRFKVRLQSIDLSRGIAGEDGVVYGISHITGDKEKIDAFIADLRKDKRITYLEFSGSTLLTGERTKHKPVALLGKSVFFVKPVVQDEHGYEHWELASTKKEDLSCFIEEVKKFADELELIALRRIDLKDIYFQKLMPPLTDMQKRVLDFAISEGYYRFPKRTTIRQLAKALGMSPSNFQKHLQKAEALIIPDAFSLLK